MGKFVKQPRTLDFTELRKEIDNLIASGIDKEYKQYRLKKRSGKGYRTISVPSDRLKALQRQILNKLKKFPKYYNTKVSFGFIEGKSIADNAIYHATNQYATQRVMMNNIHSTGIIYSGNRKIINRVVNFLNPSYALPKIKGGSRFAVRLDIANAFDSVGGSLITAEWNKEWQVSDEDFSRLLQVCLLNGTLPQGAPTSPMLLNIALMRFDRYSQGILSSLGNKEKVRLTYSRFADDINISCSAPGRNLALKIIGIMNGVAKHFGLTIKRKKTKIMTKSHGIFIHGINITNSVTHFSVSRKYRANVRAAIKRASLELDLHTKYKLIDSIIGKIAYIDSLDKTHGTKLINHAIKHGLIDNKLKINKLDASLRSLLYKNVSTERKEYFSRKYISPFNVLTTNVNLIAKSI